MNPCFSDGEVTLSLRKKVFIYDILNNLMEGAEIQKWDKYYSTQKKWQVVFSEPEYNDYVKKLFKRKKFSSWVEDNPELLFFAITYGNIDMIRFLSREEGVIHRFKERYKYPPSFRAIIAQNIEVIEFFLNHPESGLTDKDPFNNNIFHYMFLRLGKSSKGRNQNTKAEVTDLLFGERYFPRISHLLNEPNDIGATAFDYFLRDDSVIKIEDQKIMKKFIYHGAVPIQLDYIFLNEKSKDELEEKIKKSIYKIKGLAKKREKREEKEEREEREQTIAKIISNIKTYKDPCKRAIDPIVTATPKALAL